MNKLSVKVFKTNINDGAVLSSYKFIPSKVKAVFLILHGSIEHAKRYFDFAQFLEKAGIAVYTFDQRGHGTTAVKEEDVAYFSDKDDGWYRSVDDVQVFVDMIRKAHPDKKLVLFGHSMGSFLLRNYIAKYPKGVDKAVICGTGDAAAGLVSFGLMLSKMTVKLRGRRYRSKLIQKLVYGTLNDRLKNPRTAYDFISHDENVVDAYIDDNRCGNLVTCEYAREMLSGLTYIGKKKTYDMVNKDLPILIVAGAQDPLAGKDMADLNKVIDGYKSAKIKDLNVKIYSDMRHEILNEIGKEKVYTDIKDFILA